MHIYSEDRPKTSAGHPALLVDGSAVPHIAVFPEADGSISLTVNLREYDSGEPYSYSQQQITMHPMMIGQFLSEYASDPEVALWTFFAWEPKLVARRPVIAHTRTVIPNTEAMDLI